MRSRWECSEYSAASGMVTNLVCCLTLLDWSGLEEVPGNSLHIRPYPKPTQVDW